jgi:hypothetical protein
MTGYTVHTGSSKKFASGWDQIFKGQAKTQKEGGAKAATKQSGSKPAGKAKK